MMTPPGACEAPSSSGVNSSCHILRIRSKTLLWYAAAVHAVTANKRMMSFIGGQISSGIIGDRKKKNIGKPFCSQGCDE